VDATEDRLENIIKGFIDRLSNEIDIDEVILFGSHANGTSMKHSDIDLAIISDSFLGKPHIKNMQFLSRVAANYNSEIEALPFTLQEYKNLDHRTLLAGIVKTGKKFYVRKRKQ
jgi:predicted nucleotidyltransferase